MLTNDEIDDPIKRVEAYTAETSLTDFLLQLPSEELNELKIDFLTAHLDKNRLTLEGMFPKKMGVNPLDNQTAYTSDYLLVLEVQPLGGTVYD
jgi:hypothetical protein